jgi:hypothetical protein
MGAKALKKLWRASFVLLLAVHVFLPGGCSSGGSSDDSERIYGTPVDPNVFFTPPETAKSKEVKLAECMTSKGTVLYGSDACPATQRQKSLFGDGFHYLNYVECRQERQRCRDMGILYYPTWTCQKRRVTGTHSLDALAEFTGCN